MIARLTAAVVLSLTVTSTASAQKYNKEQASARPLGLDIVDRVQAHGTDAPANDFLRNELPDLTAFIKTNFEEQNVFSGRSAKAIDPTNLRLVTDASVRAYFVSEGAGYHNTLGFNVDATGVTNGDPKLIFPDASSKDSFYDPNSKSKRNKNNPLLPGDFVDLGSFTAGQSLDFFLIANGARGGTHVYGPTTADNPDGINHLVAFSYAVEDSPYLVLGFEDLFGGGDKDFNDLMFVLDVGVENVGKLVNAPEPGTFLIFGTLGVAAAVRRRRRGPTPV